MSCGEFIPTPFALSLSKGFPSFAEEEQGKGFDKLSPNGVWVLGTAAS